MTAESPSATNPYVGPRTFSTAQSHLFFGREREARDLLARVLSERLLLFYAQSGAGKSSLIYARLIPQLGERGFVVLPVGRVAGDPSAGMEQVDNIYAFNLMSSIDAGKDPARLAHLTLTEFLARLTRRRVTDTAGREHLGWVYDATVTPSPPPLGPDARRFALIIDQFEEIITANPARWQERETFFGQLDQAMQTYPNLWVVLTLREDYVAALDPYAPQMADRMRGRFYMERMGTDAARAAVREPAALGGRPFAPGVAERLVTDLSQVRVPGQDETVAGPYVEPVQLQVVCYQLWESLRDEPPGPITEADRAEAGDVNEALGRFYEDTLAAVLTEQPVRAAGVTEPALRRWFDRELITETGTRGTVYRNEAAGRTGSLPNAAADELAKRFLTRTELRGGGAWVELVHDRLVDPIRESNSAWFKRNQSALERQAAIWRDEGQPPDRLLLAGADLVEAERWAATREGELEPYEKEFLAACVAARDAAERELEAEREAARQRELEAAQALAEEQRRRADEQASAAGRLRRRALIAAAIGAIAAVLGVAALGFGIQSRQNAGLAAGRAIEAQANADLAATREVDARNSAHLAGTKVVEAQTNANLAATRLAIAESNMAQAQAALQLLYTPTPPLLTPTVPVGFTAMAPAILPPTATPELATTATVVAAQTVEAIQTQLAQALVVQQQLAVPTQTPISADRAPIAQVTPLFQEVEAIRTALATPTATRIPPPRGRIVYTSNRGNPSVPLEEGSALWVINLASGDQTQLTFIRSWEPSYSIRRNVIAFTSRSESGKVNIYEIPASGGDPRLLDEGLWDNWESSYNADGSRVVFTSSRNSPSGSSQDWEIWTMGISGGSNPQMLTDDDPEINWSPSWSPDGKYIAYFSTRMASPGQVDIWRMNSDGSNKTRLTTKNWVENNPNQIRLRNWEVSWSPDSRQLAFPSNRDGNGEIYIMDLDGKNQRNLTQSPVSDEFDPAWSLDGNWIALARNTSTGHMIVLRSIDGRQERALTGGGQIDRNPAWIP